jgi:2',3'-cyclic-nucleotide 2'-phosphodiesterase (5'-nucleotidase family)/sulfur carrier protein ThiS
MGADGVLYASRGRPNPSGSGADALFLFQGNPAAAPVREIVAAPGVTLPGPPDIAPDRPFRLRLLHFNDLHGRLADVSEYASTPVFSRLAGYIKQARKTCASQPEAGLLVFSGGDDLIGSPFAELMGCRPSAFICHPAYRLYTAAEVAAGAVGNHDLDWGLDMLALSAGQDAAFPLLSANLVPTAGTEAPGIYPAALFMVKGLRVGVIGLTTPAEIKHLLPGEFAVTDPLVAVGNLLPALRPLCDVLIVLSHLGYSLASASAVTAGMGDVELAQALPHGAVDLIIGSHTHSLLHESGFDPAQRVNGIPIVQAGAGGRYLGEVVVDVTPAGVAVTEARLHPVAALAEDAAFEAMHVQPLTERVQRMLCEPLGAMTRWADAGSAGAKAELPRFVADALAARCRAAGFAVDFALVDASSVCAELPTCRPLILGDLFRLAPYADSIVLRRFTPAQLRAFLDDNALRYNPTGWPVAEGEERGFVQFSREVYCRVEMAAENDRPGRYACTIAGRHLEAELAGRTRPYLVACSSFLRQLAHRWEREQRVAAVALFDLHAVPEEQTGLALREALVAHLRETLGASTEAEMIIYVEPPSLQPGEPPRRERLEDVRTVAEVWARLDLGQASGLAVLVNGRLADWRTELRDGDVVRLLRAPGGG